LQQQQHSALVTAVVAYGVANLDKPLTRDGVYLPTAFLADLGLVALVLYFITQSGKDIKLPWPKLNVKLDEVKPPKKSVVSKIATNAIEMNSANMNINILKPEYSV
jgi:hypothetical protein